MSVTELLPALIVPVFPESVPTPELAREMSVDVTTFAGFPLASCDSTVTEKLVPAVALPGTAVITSFVGVCANVVTVTAKVNNNGKNTRLVEMQLSTSWILC